MSISRISNNSITNALQGQVKPLSDLPSKKIPTTDIEKLNNIVKASEAGANYQKADNSRDNLYAQVKVSGKVVANIWKSGLVELPNAYAHLSSEITATSSASDRAEQIAKALGGEISYASNGTETPSYSFSESLKKILDGR
ncbi:hypothetical protein ACFOJE_20530 [Azotobacter bryophylli]|uniref:Uncharacterized protein n=1 Tax=Azotobacter bryophylli TaxID=1986537 RepID=A0ABV7AYX0_9GAMM